MEENIKQWTVRRKWALVLETSQGKTKATETSRQFESQGKGEILAPSRMSKQQLVNVWDAIEDTPEEAENMNLRSTLLNVLKTTLPTPRSTKCKLRSFLV